MIEDFTNMVEKSLNLSEPWCVKGTEFHPEEPAIHIFLDIKKRAKIPCPKCGGETKRYGYEPHERVWRHGDCMFYPTLIHCRRPKVLCPKCGVQQVNAPFERKDSRFTLMFEGYAMLIMASIPIAKAAKALRCDKGHDYVTVIIDAAKRAIIDVEPGKDASTVERFADKLTRKGGSCNEIKSVTGDMSAAFLSNLLNTIAKSHPFH